MKELKKYFWEIKCAIPCGKSRRKMLRDLRCSVENFLEENPDATYETVVNHFGTPAQIADTYMEETPPKELQQQLRIRKRIIGLVAGLVAAVVLIWATGVGIIILRELCSDRDILVIEQAVEETGNISTEIGE